jgi:hypothetical protein
MIYKLANRPENPGPGYWFFLNMHPKESDKIKIWCQDNLGDQTKMYMDENNWLPTENFRWSIITGLGIGYYLVFWRKEDTALFMGRLFGEQAISCHMHHIQNSYCYKVENANPNDDF